MKERTRRKLNRHALAIGYIAAVVTVVLVIQALQVIGVLR